MAKQQYSIASARNNLPSIVHSVETGPAVELTRRGRPVAVLVSRDEYQRLTGEAPDLWQAIQEFRQTADLEELDIESALENVRDRSTGRDVEL